MIHQVREWLPNGVTQRDAVRARIKQAVVAWSERWFEGRPIRGASLREFSGEARLSSEISWKAYRSEIALGTPRRGELDLAACALDLVVDATQFTDLDREVVDAFDAKVKADLVSALTGALGLAADTMTPPVAVREPFGRMGGLLFELIDAGGRLVACVAIPLPCLLPACRQALAPPRPATARLNKIMRAVAETGVTICATLGEARLPLDALQELAVGDVIILDTALRDGVELAAKTSDAPFARATLSSSDGAFALTLLP